MPRPSKGLVSSSASGSKRRVGAARIMISRNSRNQKVIRIKTEGDTNRDRKNLMMGALLGVLGAVLGGIIGGFMQSYAWYRFDQMRAAEEARQQWIRAA